MMFFVLFVWAWVSQMWSLCVAQANLELSAQIRLTLNLKESSYPALPPSAGITGIKPPAQLIFLFCEFSPDFPG